MVSLLLWEHYGEPTGLTTLWWACSIDNVMVSLQHWQHHGEPIALISLWWAYCIDNIMVSPTNFFWSNLKLPKFKTNLTLIVSSKYSAAFHFVSAVWWYIVCTLYFLKKVINRSFNQQKKFKLILLGVASTFAVYASSIQCQSYVDLQRLLHLQIVNTSY